MYVMCIMFLLIVAAAFFLQTNDMLRHGIFTAVRQSVPQLAGKWYWQSARLLQGNHPHVTDIHFVEDFNRLNQQIRQLEREMRLEAAQGRLDPSTEQRWQQLREEREKVRPFAEAVVEQQVAAVLKDEGLELFLGRILPPPRFVFADSYYVLVASPRHEIRFATSRLLGSDMAFSAIEETERQFEQRNTDMAALVQQIGGLAVVYPAQIFHEGDVRRLLEISVHEWIHQYLFIASPLGRAFLKGGSMHTINETVANLLGREIGDRVYLRFYAPEGEQNRLDEEYASYLEKLAASQPLAEPSTPKDEGFDFAGFMRSTYLEAVRLLAEEKIEEAEGYMEECRQILVAEGYNIRKLNQAYFAFHGGYADTPGAIDPIGPALAELRLKTASPKEFIAELRNVTSYAEFLSVMDEWDISMPTKKRESDG